MGAADSVETCTGTNVHLILRGNPRFQIEEAEPPPVDAGREW
jgi:hypothetical protein